MVCLKYAAYFSYTIIQISRYSNMLQICQVCAALYSSTLSTEANAVRILIPIYIRYCV